LFREYKDPAIQAPQFRPLFDRLRHILDLSALAASRDLDTIDERNDELVRFVAELKMGSFYSAELKRLLEREAFGVFWTDASVEDERRWA
jgi:hypothetical protein